MSKEFQVGIKALIRVEDKCLVLLSSQDYWDVPGGRIDSNETIEETLRRELSEEVPSLERYDTGEITHSYRLSSDMPNGMGLVLLFYKVEAEMFDVTLSDEHKDFMWVTKETLPDLLDSEYKIEPGYYRALEIALE